MNRDWTPVPDLPTLLLAFLILLVLGCLSPLLPQEQADPALCGSDTDCMKLCSPDDRECDGGPEPSVTRVRS